MLSLARRNPLPFDCPFTYQIIVEGRIDATWSDRLEDMTICQVTSDTQPPVTTTTLEGELKDQASLAGVLNSLYELHLPILMVMRLSVEPSKTKNDEELSVEKRLKEFRALFSQQTTRDNFIGEGGRRSTGKILQSIRFFGAAGPGKEYKCHHRRQGDGQMTGEIQLWLRKQVKVLARR
jgi:hypothetical protein